MVPLLAAHSLAVDFVLLALVVQLLLHMGEFLSGEALFSVKTDSIDE
ncbi:hypothetical protein ACFLTR_00095 [Chloroflexota bacterium]